MAKLSWLLPQQALREPGLPDIRSRDDLNELMDWTGFCWSLYIGIVDHQLSTKEDLNNVFKALWFCGWSCQQHWKKNPPAVTKLENCASGNKMLKGQNNYSKPSRLGLALIYFRREERGERAKLMRKGVNLVWWGKGMVEKIPGRNQEWPALEPRG